MGTLHLAGIPPTVPNTTSTILQVGEQMWVVNDIAGAGNMQCVCTNPSGQHCTNYRPCYSYTWHWDTFATAQYLGREKIGVEWIQNHGVGNSSKTMELDHFIMWSHHIWTDPVSRRLVRAWKPFNGLQVSTPRLGLTMSRTFRSLRLRHRFVHQPLTSPARRRSGASIAMSMAITMAQTIHTGCLGRSSPSRSRRLLQRLWSSLPSPLLFDAMPCSFNQFLQ